MLVIIGLVAGGVLVGKDLYTMAQARSLMGQVEKIQVAANTFKLKYNCRAGDCRTALSFGLGTSGNGDEVFGLCGTWPWGAWLNSSDGCATRNPRAAAWYFQHSYTLGEQQMFWVHLANAELIDGKYQEMPIINSVNNLSPYLPKDSIGKAHLKVFTWGNKTFLRTGLTNIAVNYNSPQFNIKTLTGHQAEYINSKFYKDVYVNANIYQTLGNSGRNVVPLGYWANSSDLSVPTQGNCVIADGSGGYKFNLSTAAGCNMMWQLDY